MKITSNLTHIATEVEFEAAKNADELQAAFAAQGLPGFPAELDIAERTEDHVQMLSLDAMLQFARAANAGAVTYDVTYFPHADEAEVDYQLNQLAHDLRSAPRSSATCARPRSASTWRSTRSATRTSRCTASWRPTSAARPSPGTA